MNPYAHNYTSPFGKKKKENPSADADGYVLLAEGNYKCEVVYAEKENNTLKILLRGNNNKITQKNISLNNTSATIEWLDNNNAKPYAKIIAKIYEKKGKWADPYHTIFEEYKDESLRVRKIEIIILHLYLNENILSKF